MAFGVRWKTVTISRPFLLRSLYLHVPILRLAQELFRGEPAITQLDWNFTTSHKSSAVFSTNVGSALQRVLPLLQPVHG